MGGGKIVKEKRFRVFRVFRGVEIDRKVLGFRVRGEECWVGWVLNVIESGRLMSLGNCWVLWVLFRVG